MEAWIKENTGRDITFDKWMAYIENYNGGGKPSSTMLEIKRKLNKKLTGDLFEEFCKLYCRGVMGFGTVWLLKELPDDIRVQLSLPKQDFGIDLVAYDSKDGTYSAVQAKFKQRSHQRRKSFVTWKELSTFYAIVTKTGPFKKHIVITTADSVRHIGRKQVGVDVSVCKQKLKGITWAQWIRMGGGREVGTEEAKQEQDAREADWVACDDDDDDTEIEEDLIVDDDAKKMGGDDAETVKETTKTNSQAKAKTRVAKAKIKKDAALRISMVDNRLKRFDKKVEDLEE